MAAKRFSSNGPGRREVLAAGMGLVAARDIKADVEVISPEDINTAYDRVVKKDVRYRFVIDMAKMK